MKYIYYTQTCQLDKNVRKCSSVHCLVQRIRIPNHKWKSFRSLSVKNSDRHDDFYFLIRSLPTTYYNALLQKKLNFCNEQIIVTKIKFIFVQPRKIKKQKISCKLFSCCCYLEQHCRGCLLFKIDCVVVLSMILHVYFGELFVQIWYV